MDGIMKTFQKAQEINEMANKVIAQQTELIKLLKEEIDASKKRIDLLEMRCAVLNAVLKYKKSEKKEDVDDVIEPHLPDDRESAEYFNSLLK